MMKSLLTKFNSFVSTARIVAAAAICFAALNSYGQTTVFNYTGALQTYTVPAGVTLIRIDAQGAQGGSITIACAATGGLGARMVGDVTVTPGEVITVLVGGQGQTQGEDGGGGGGSFTVRTGNVPLVIAGGGGGATNNIQICTGLRNGVDGTTSTSGTASANGLVAGGTPGNGGGANVGSGCGGGGFNTDGGYAANMNGRGRAYINGGAGGTGQNNNHGGYGGGGCGWYNGGNGGGGGGYSGGGTDGNYPSTYFGGGGGGGSYNIGTNQNNVAGFRTGNGLVQITVLTVAGEALDFDGVDDVALGAAPNMQNTDFTIEFWAKRRTASTTEGMFLIGTDGINNGAIFMYMFNNGGLSFGFWGNDLVINQGSGQYQDLLWHHYALTYNTTTNRRTVYRDGVQIGTDIATADFTGNTSFMVGQFGGHSRTDGSIDEFRIWNRELCQSEIQNNMSCEIPTTGSGLLRNFHFNHGVAGGVNAGVTSLVDYSVSASNLTVTNCALTGATSNWIAPGGVATGTTCGVFVNGINGTLSSQGNVTCFGGANGSATVSATGVSPYYYAWAPSGGTGATATGLVAGTYTCTITNLCGGVTTVTVTITEPAVLAASTTSSNITCFGSADGSASSNVTGGTSPYTYVWSNGATTSGISGLSAGVYTCTVTCANGCVTTTSATITEPAVLTASTSLTNISCFGSNDGSATLTASGGTSPYTYLWSNGDPTATTLGLSAGTYVGTVTCTNGCTVTATAIITEPSQIAVSVTQTNVACNGDSTGSIDLTVSGGTSPYTFDWNSGAYTTEDLSGLPAGTYVGMLTDANGCSDSGTVVITESAVLVAILAIATDTVCSTDGMFMLTGESPSGGTFSGPGVSAGMFDPATAGVGTHTISYSYTDSLGCTANTSDSIYVDVCTDVRFTVAGSQFTVFPNPNDGTFILQTSSAANVMIYDAQGKLISTQKVQPNIQTQINLEISGMYMITVITTDGQRSSQRVIVTRQ